MIHGFSSSGFKPHVTVMKDEFLKWHDVNVFIVDWKWGAIPPNYFSAAENIKTVGRGVGEFILKYSINTSSVHCVGHSLGAHVRNFKIILIIYFNKKFLNLRRVVLLEN